MYVGMSASRDGWVVGLSVNQRFDVLSIVREVATETVAEL